MSDFEVFSLDTETSGLDPELHQLLSIGMVHYGSGAELHYNIRHTEIVAQAEAMRVNGIDVGRLDSSDREPLKGVDESLTNFVRGCLPFKGTKAVAMGLNVGSFDMRFIDRYLPHIGHLLCSPSGVYLKA